MSKKVHHKFNSIMMRLFVYREIVEEMLVYLVGEPWISNLDFNTIEDVSKDFVSPDELDDFQSDILWKVKLKNSDNKILIYIHTEFQSTPNRLMPFRFLNYQYLVYEKIISQRKGKDKKALLPFIFPILFYHGEKKWNYSMNISDLIEIPFKEAKNYIPEFKFFKIMINEKTYEELASHESVLANNFACNNVKSKEEFIIAIERVSKLLKSLIPEEHKLQLSKDIAKYLSFISNGKVSTGKIIDILNKYEEDKMTLVQLFKQEKEEGREEGKLEGKVELAKRMIKANLDIKQISEITGFSINELEDLQVKLKSEGYDAK